MSYAACLASSSVGAFFSRVSIPIWFSFPGIPGTILHGEIKHHRCFTYFSDIQVGLLEDEK